MSGEDSFFQPDQTGSSLAEDDFEQQNGGTEEAQMSSSGGGGGGGGSFNPGASGPAFDPADFTDSGAPPSANGFNSTGGSNHMNASGVSAQFAPPAEEPEAVVAMKEHLKQRLSDGDEAEFAGKKQAEEDAKAYLQEFYEKRHATKESRIQEHREAHKLLGSQKPQGANGWERAISLIDFNFTRPSGSDLSRYRNVLFNAKGRGTTAA